MNRLQGRRVASARSGLSACIAAGQGDGIEQGDGAQGHQAPWRPVWRSDFLVPHQVHRAHRRHANAHEALRHGLFAAEYELVDREALQAEQAAVGARCQKE